VTKTEKPLLGLVELRKNREEPFVLVILE